MGNQAVHLLAQGSQGPDVVMLHGVPTNALLWRHVQPRLATSCRTWVVDLPGFGRSDPVDRQSDLTALASAFDSVLAELGIARPILVAIDLGLLVALQWLALRPHGVRALVLMEGFFLPMSLTWPLLPLSTRLMMHLARCRWLAERVIVRDDSAVEKFVNASVVRRLSPDELAGYAEPWRQPESRRRAWLHGIHAGRLVPPARRAGDAVSLVDAGATALARLAAPKLLLVATPGMVVTPAIVEVARSRLANLDVVNVGPGRHLLPEDQPVAIAAAIEDFIARLHFSSGIDGQRAERPS